MIKKAIGFALKHKVVAGIAAVAVLGAGYYSYKSFFGTTSAARYVSVQAQKGTIVISVSGSGQVSASTQFELKPKASGNVVYIRAKEGQRMAAGALIAQLDSTDAQKAVRDAESNLESAKLGLEQLKLSSANLDKLYDDAFAYVSNAFLNAPTTITFAKEVISGDTLNPKAQLNSDFYKNFVSQYYDVEQKKISLLVDSALSDYLEARKNYDDTFLLYKNTSRYVDKSTIDKLLSQSIETEKSLAQALKSEQNVLDFLSDYSSTYSQKLPTQISTYQASLKTYIGQTNSDLSNLISINNSIQNAPLNIKSQELSVTQRENALQDAKENLSNYYIRAPFNSVLAKLNVQTGDPASAGASLATLISSQKIAEIPLNEVDVSKVKEKQKATLTFDAIPDFSVAGEVAQIDTLGTVTQGVVTYNVKIAFETGDERVKLGMSVSASIVTDVKSDVLLVPNSAVKSSGNNYYVQVVDVKTNSSSTAAGEVTPRQVIVQTGLSNDTVTEITNGLKEGDEVVTQTVTQTASQNQSQQSSGIRIPGITTGGGGGGVLRVGGGGSGGAEAPH